MLDVCCHKCAEGKSHPQMPSLPLSSAMMIVCKECGYKRCPKASDHTLACTRNNAPNQPGSIYRYTVVR